MRELREKIKEDTPAIDRFKVLCEKSLKGGFPVGFLEGVLTFGIDLDKAAKGVKAAKRRADAYEFMVRSFESGEEMLEIGRKIGQDLGSSPEPGLLRKSLWWICRLTEVVDDERMFGPADSY